MSMKPMAAALLLSAFPVLATATPAEPTTDELVSEARALVKNFGGTLKQALQQAVKDGGLANGIAGNTLAPEIAAQNSQELEIARTSLKLRNPDNAPTEWQQLQRRQWMRNRYGTANRLRYGRCQTPKGSRAFST